MRNLRKALIFLYSILNRKKQVCRVATATLYIFFRALVEKKLYTKCKRRGEFKECQCDLFCKEIEKLIFPPCCLICGKLTNKNLCNECKKEIYEKAIFKIENKDKEEYYFKKHIYVFLYKDKIRNLILDYKFNDKSYLYKIFAEIIIKNKKICGILEKYDIIIPVPIHKKRKKQRGYNQSELIAKEIASKLEGLEYQGNVLEKIIHTLPQSSLSKEQRKQNVQNVYELLNKEKINNKRIILFDDIYTTGSTVNAIAKLLKENGAKEILVLTIAKD